MANREYNVAVVGATGAVGTALINLLWSRRFPMSYLRVLARKESIGQTTRYMEGKAEVMELSPLAFHGIDLAFLAVDALVAKVWAPVAAGAGATVIDNSSAFRADPAVPLVIPEINSEDINGHRGIIASPNCTTTIILMALHPLYRTFGIKRIFGASYQAASGAGKEGMRDLDWQLIQHITGKGEVESFVFPHRLFANVIPQVGSFQRDGYTTEECKIQEEGRKIMHHPDFLASLTCVRVPVYRAHSAAVNAEFARPISVEAVREVLAQAPGIDLIDDPERGEYPLPITQEKKLNCAVGRIRKDCALENGLAFWVSGDQLLKGAALNAVQIAEHSISV